MRAVAVYRALDAGRHGVPRDGAGRAGGDDHDDHPGLQPGVPHHADNHQLLRMPGAATVQPAHVCAADAGRRRRRHLVRRRTLRRRDRGHTHRGGHGYRAAAQVPPDERHDDDNQLDHNAS